MIKQLKYQNITWINLTAPTKEEINKLEGDYSIHQLVGHELLEPSNRAKVDVYDDYIYLILHFPADKIQRPVYGEDVHEDDIYEVDFVLGKDFLITTHYESIPPLEEFSQILEASASLLTNKKEKQAVHAGHIFYYIIRQLYQSLEISLGNINLKLKRTEQKIFAGKEAEMVKTLSELNRQLLDFRWALRHHREIIDSLTLAGADFYGDKFKYYLSSISGEYEKISRLVDSNRENFIELRSTNESLLSIKINQIMKILTAITAILLPVNLVAQIFGMSGTETNMLIIKDANGFVIALVLMIVVGIIATIIARVKKWI